MSLVFVGALKDDPGSPFFVEVGQIFIAR